MKHAADRLPSPPSPSALSAPSVTSALDDSLLSLLRRRVVALAVALRLGDRGVAAVVAERLRRSLQEAEGLRRGGRGRAGLEAATAAQLDAHLRAARRLLAEVPEQVTPRQLHRWMAAPPSLGSAGAGADLFDLDGRGRDLELAQLGQLHLLQCQLAGAQLHRASFEGAVVDSCDLTSINARASRWRGAMVLRGRLQGATLFEAELEGAIFSDCDLRGADLSSRPGGAGGDRSIWVRCDLRNTVWTHRAMPQAHFVGCRMSDARELRLGEGSSVVRCEPALALPEWEARSEWSDEAGERGERTRRDPLRMAELASQMVEATERDLVTLAEQAAARERTRTARGRVTVAA